MFVSNHVTVINPVSRGVGQIFGMTWIFKLFWGKIHKFCLREKAANKTEILTIFLKRLTPENLQDPFTSPQI